MFGTVKMSIGLKGNDAEITYTVTGRYRSATWYDPPEGPDIDVDDVRIFGKGLLAGRHLRRNYGKTVAKYGTEISEAIDEHLSSLVQVEVE